MESKSTGKEPAVTRVEIATLLLARYPHSGRERMVWRQFWGLSDSGKRKMRFYNARKWPMWIRYCTTTSDSGKWTNAVLPINGSVLDKTSVMYIHAPISCTLLMLVDYNSVYKLSFTKSTQL